MADKYNNLLFEQFKTKEALLTERINLEAILQLPKGTEHYISDIHGEYEAFAHTLRNGAGIIREKIYFLFPELATPEKEALALFVYYPERSLTTQEKMPDDWYAIKLDQIIILLKDVAGKYSRSKLRKALPKNFAYLAEELIFRFEIQDLKESYYLTIINKLIQLNQMTDFLIAICQTIQRLVVDHLHVVGDIFDRGRQVEKVMDELIAHHNVDIQWGNHDILWLGAMAGSKICLAALLRIAARYNYLDDIEAAYGFNLRHLFIFAEKNYANNEQFHPKNCSNEGQKESLSKVHQALTIIQYKLESQLSIRRPEFKLAGGKLLHNLSSDQKKIQIKNHSYQLINGCFQLVDKKQPDHLTLDEELVISALLQSFQNSQRLKRHLDFLMTHGGMYLVYNGQLLFHGCIPLDENGNFKNVNFGQQNLTGKKLLDFFDNHLRLSYANPCNHIDFDTDLFWYAWCGKYSPLFGKEKMATFERYFINDKESHHEKRNPYFSFRNQSDYCEQILAEFGLSGNNAHIINGHTPIKVTQGESPIKADGKLFVIDGGLSKAYQQTTGIGGYTLLYTSTGFQIVTHQPFNSVADLFIHQKAGKTVSTKRIINHDEFRILIKDTSIGEELQRQIADLEDLIQENFND
ncbi:fructose-1,6-bisphosphatase [Enterococcus sp. MMGLQ5-2]|nr:fructose-1,6-bisphosphatase [Enterococcus sp. MMGLQ5-2]MBS7585077.1 fructose-1,6-bisphosphatase [Enterococcus sp. MMGLQ5-1]